MTKVIFFGRKIYFVEVCICGSIFMVAVPKVVEVILFLPVHPLLQMENGDAWDPSDVFLFQAKKGKSYQRGFFLFLSPTIEGGGSVISLSN